MMTDPKLIQFVDTPLAVTYSASGEAYVQWPGGGNVLSLNGYTLVSMEVLGSAHTKTYDVIIGKISGSTLSSVVAAGVAAGTKIHSYQVIGPELGIVLHGAPNTTEHIQLWVYLRP